MLEQAYDGSQETAAGSSDCGCERRPVNKRVHRSGQLTFEELVEIGQLELPSYSVRDANPPSQFVEAASFGDSNYRANSVNFDVLAIHDENRRATHDALA